MENFLQDPQFMENVFLHFMKRHELHTRHEMELQTRQQFKEKFAKILEDHKAQKPHFDALKNHYLQFKTEKQQITNDASNNNVNEYPDLDNLPQQQSQTKSTNKIALPDLKAYPKDFPKPQDNEFLVRKTVLEYFRKFEEWDEEAVNNKGHTMYGYYFSGPNGIGKSVAVYFIACLARAHDWFVIYMPYCDHWVGNSTDTSSAIRLLLEEIARGAALYLNTQLKNPFIGDPNVKTLEDLLAAGLASTDDAFVGNVLQSVRQELEEWTKTPLLLIFDEVNALFTMTPTWLNGKLPKDNPAFSIAASLNRLKLKRGWKLITGTGHERFLNDIQPALGKWVRNWLPYSKEEFNDLLTTVGHPWLLNTLKSIKSAPVMLQLDIRVKNILGCVPRQLYELNTYLKEKVFVHDGHPISPEEYFKSKGLTDPQEQISDILEDFQQESQKLFLDDCNSYLVTLNGDEKAQLLGNLLSLFFPHQGGNTVVFSRRYLDRSLVYIDESNQYHFLTPVAQSAILQVLRSSDAMKADKDIDDIMSNLKARDEKGRPFERLFTKKLLLLSSSSAITVDVEDFAGEHPEPLKLECSSTIVIPENVWCPCQEILVPTLLVPQTETYPIADFVLFNPTSKSLVILQLTLQEHKRKSPTTKPYPALWDTGAWKELCGNNKRRKHNNANNYIEELLRCFGFMKMYASIEDGRIQVREENQLSPFKVHWVIVCPNDLPKENNAYHDLAVNFPWVQILSVDSLKQIVGPQIVEALRRTK